MGFYTVTMVYFGRLLSQQAYDNLEVYPDFDKSWIKDIKDPRGRYILAPPGCIITIGGMDQIIENHEIRQGFVKWTEVVKICSGHKELTDKLQKMEEVIDSQYTHFKLKEFIRVASCEEQNVFYGKYIIEMTGSSLDKFNSWNLKYNLRIM